MFCCIFTDPNTLVIKAVVFFFFSYAYTTSPAAVMKLVVFFRSSKPSLHD